MKDLTQQGMEKAKLLEERFGKEFHRGKNLFGEFKKFAMRGNVLDLAVGVIIGAAFGKIVTSLVNDMIMPSLGLLIGKNDLKQKFIALDHKAYPTFEAAQAAKAPILAYGNFLQNILDFVIVAFVIFIAIRYINKLSFFAPGPVTTKECPQCASTIPIKATRCGHCTQPLPAT
jgi:large conductance mechanosensitive channel